MIFGNPYGDSYGIFRIVGTATRTIIVQPAKGQSSFITINPITKENESGYIRWQLSMDGTVWGNVEPGRRTELAVKAQIQNIVHLRAVFISTGESPVLHSCSVVIENSPGIALEDKSGYGLHGIIHSLKRVEGYNYKAIELDGVNDYITLPIGFNATSNKSFSCMIKGTNIDGPLLIVGDRSVANIKTVEIWIENGKLTFKSYRTDTQSMNTLTPCNTLLNDGSWHHIVVTYGRPAPNIGDSMTGYVDGVPCGSSMITLGPDSTGSTGWIGKCSSSLFRGVIDSLCIYSAILGDTDIDLLYHIMKAEKGTFYGEEILAHSVLTENIKAQSIKASRIEHFPRQIPDTIVDVAPPQHPGLEQITADFMVHFPCTIMLRSLSPGIDFRNTVIQGFPESGPETYHAGTHSELYTLMPGRYRLKHRTGVRMLVSGVFGTQNTAECITLL